MGHLALTRAILTCICTANAAAAVTSHGSASSSAAASSCTDAQMQELDGQSSLLQLGSGSTSQTDDVDDTATHESNPEAKVDLKKVTFNCKIGFVHWRKGWSDLKKSYCCRTEHIGCLDTTDVTSDTSNVTTSKTCVTGEPLRDIVGYTTSPAGTPCIFGLDQRDEGTHCILSDMKYGALGWCYTSESKGSWGACTESCPLFGHLKVVGNKVKKLRKEIEKLEKLVNSTVASKGSDAGESAKPSAAPKAAKKKTAAVKHS